MIKKVLGGFGTVAGATYPCRALFLFIRYPKLLGYIVLPIIINLIIAILIYGSLLFFGLEFIEELEVDISTRLGLLIADLPAWLSILNYGVSGLIFLLQFLLTIILFVATGFILTQFGVLLGAPWYGKLSEKLEEIRTGNIAIVEVSFVRDIGRAILYEIKKIVFMIVFGIPLLIINFFPGIGTLIVTGGWFILTTIIVGLDFMDSALERRRLQFRKKLNLVIKSFPASASFALVCFFLISIPLVNLLTIPLCVASGTLFVCDRILPIDS